MTSTISIRIDETKKREAETLFASLGLSLSSAVNLFIAKALDFQGIPFPVRREQPRSPALDEAVAEARALARDPSAKRYSDLDELFADALR